MTNKAIKKAGKRRKVAQMKQMGYRYGSQSWPDFLSSKKS